MFIPEIDTEATDFAEAARADGAPERRLLLAILERAILDYVGNNAEEVAAAEEWLFSTERPLNHEKDEFSFTWICEHLDLDRFRISETIRNMPKRGENRVAPWYFMNYSEEKKAMLARRKKAA